MSECLLIPSGRGCSSLCPTCCSIKASSKGSKASEGLFGGQILIDASNGASDYGNKFGEPLVAGYSRTFGLRLSNGERREWIKPIMFR